jgi:RNA polymerase primary sigma factor
VQKWINDRPSDSDLQLEHVQEVYSTLVGLTVREHQVLDMRSGLDGDPRTLKAIGDDMGVSVERVRQIEAKALRKLRKFKAKDTV